MKDVRTRDVLTCLRATCGRAYVLCAYVLALGLFGGVVSVLHAQDPVTITLVRWPFT